MCDEAKAKFAAKGFQAVRLSCVGVCLLSTLLTHAPSPSPLKKAYDLWNQALALDETMHHVRHNLAVCQLQLGDPMKALEAVNRAVAKGGAGVAKYYSTKGNALHRLRRYGEALEAYQQGLSRDPAQAGCLEGLQRAKEAAAATPPPVPPRGGGGGGGGGGAASGEITLDAEGFPRVLDPVPEPLAAPLDALAALRAASVLCACAYLAPLPSTLTAPAWRYFILLTAAANLFAGWRAVMGGGAAAAPALAWANRAALGEWAVRRFVAWSCNLGLPPVALPLMVLLMSPLPTALSAFSALPAVAVNLYYVVERLCGALPGAAGAAAGAVGDALAPSAKGKVGEARRSALLQRVAVLSSRGEVIVFLFYVALLATPSRSVVGVMFLWQLQQTKFLFNPHTRDTFRAADARVKGALQRGPAVVLRGYEAAAAWAYKRATSALQQQRP